VVLVTLQDYLVEWQTAVVVLVVYEQQLVFL
jgi:hypothetical protein